MSTLKELTPNAAVRDILPDALATVVSVQWFGSEALELTYKGPSGKVANELLYRHDEPRLEVVEQGRPMRRMVKGRVSGAPTITVTKNEILYSLNKPDDFILAVVEFDGPLPAGPDGTAQPGAHRVHYVRRPFQREPDFGVTSVNYNFAELLQKAEEPR